jgi:hypothetical protein
MLNISKYHKLIVGCGAIATASIGGFVQSADAAGTHNQIAQSEPSITLIAGNNGSNHGGGGVSYNGSNHGGYNGSNHGGFNGSNNGGKGPDRGGLNGSNNGGKSPVISYYDANGPKGPGTYYYYGGGKNGSNNGGLNGSNNGGNGPKGPGYYYDANGPKGPGYYAYLPSPGPNPLPGPGPVVIVPGPNPLPGPGPVVIGTDGKPLPGPTIGKFPQNGSDGGGNNNSNSNGSNFGGIRSGFSAGNIARSQALGSRISLAQGKYDAALASLAAAEASTPNTSSKTSPVRYGREVADASTCGCLNTENPSAGTPSKELVAARAAEADAAAELAAAKAEARQFLESVKSESGGSGTYQPIW